MPVVHLFCSLEHYRDHALPILDALPVENRGEVWMPKNLALRLGTKVWPGYRRAPRGLWIVAAYADLRAVSQPAVLVEHGAGQTYGDENPSYSGGADRAAAVLFLCPNEVVAERNRAAYPDTPSEVIGCAKLDRHFSGTSRRSRPTTTYEEQIQPTVALSWHWDGQRVAPEARSAFPHYDPGLPAFVTWARDQGIALLGHGHPRIYRRLARRWRELGVEAVADFDEVLARADVYAVDNSSSAFEAAAVGLKVVTMNCPWYRRDVDFFPRFWAHADVGVQVDGPEQLPDAVLRALDDPPEVAEARQRAVEAVYGRLDGHAAQRGAEAVLRVLQSQAWPTLPNSVTA